MSTIESFIQGFHEYLKNNNKPAYYSGYLNIIQEISDIDLWSITEKSALDILLSQIEEHKGITYNTRFGKDNLRTVARLIYRFNIGFTDLNADLDEIKNNRSLTETEKLTLFYARVGQGKFREDLITLYSGKCMITGLSIPEILIASHIKPWRHCDSSEEKLSKFNGLLLSATYDKLFDRLLISFNDDGSLVLSKKLTQEELDKLKLSNNITIKFEEDSLPFIQYHRELFKENEKQ